MFLGFCIFMLAIILLPNFQTVEAADGFFGDPADICKFWKAIFDFAIRMAGALTMLMILIGGLFYMLAGGSTFEVMKDGKKTNVDMVKKAKDLMAGALFGMMLALLAYVAFTVLNPYLLECRIEIPKVDLSSATCGDGKTYSSQADCEKYEGDCSEKSTRCIQGQKACKAHNEKIDSMDKKSECCSGAAKQNVDPSAIDMYIVTCVGGPDKSKKDQWCCPKATPTVDPCADVEDDKLLATEKECKEKGGQDGGKCKGSCLQSTGGTASGDDAKKSGESSNTPSNTTNSSESSEEDSRKDKWCCVLSECKTTSGYKQFTGGWQGKQYGKECTGATMQKSGCGPTAIADVLSGYGKSGDPWTIAQELDSKGLRKCKGGTQPHAIKSILETHGLKSRSVNWESAKKGLQQGKLVIAHARSYFTTSGGHYIVLKCYKDGQVEVNDVGAGNHQTHRNGYISESIVSSNTNIYILVEP